MGVELTFAPDDGQPTSLGAITSALTAAGIPWTHETYDGETQIVLHPDDGDDGGIGMLRITDPVRIDFLTFDTFPAATPADIDEVCAVLAAVGLAGVDEF